MKHRSGFTLIELLIVMLITGIILAAGYLFVPRWVADRWMNQGAANLHAQIVTSRMSVLSGQANRPEQVVGFRLIPDPEWPLVQRADGTIDPTAPRGYARTVPLVLTQPYVSGRVAVHTDGFPAGFTPAWGRLVLEQAPVDPDGARAEPTTWYWLVRLGEVVTLNGHDYTICGPCVVPPGPQNPDGFVNVGWPPAVSPLDRGAGPMEFLYLANRIDDGAMIGLGGRNNPDGYVDSGWDGLDNDLDGYTDEADEWEVELWRNVPPEGLASASYSIARRPVAADARTGGDVADRKLLPSPVVVDGLRSVLPTNPFTGSVDLVFDEHGGCWTPSFHGRPAVLPLNTTHLYFWIVQRADVTTPPDADGLAKVVGLDLRTGKATTDDVRVATGAY